MARAIKRERLQIISYFDFKFDIEVKKFIIFQSRAVNDRNHPVVVASAFAKTNITQSNRFSKLSTITIHITHDLISKHHLLNII